MTSRETWIAEFKAILSRLEQDEPIPGTSPSICPIDACMGASAWSKLPGAPWLALYYIDHLCLTSELWWDTITARQVLQAIKEWEDDTHGMSTLQDG